MTPALALRPLLGKALTPTGTDPHLIGPAERIRLTELATTFPFTDDQARFAGRSVLILTRSQTAAARALVALDGLARRMVLAPPDFSMQHLALVAQTAEVDLIISDGQEIENAPVPVISLGPPLPFASNLETPATATEWALFTSGTTGAPKMVVHSLAGLAGAILAGAPPTGAVIWGTYYDIRRYGGLQILLRALIGGAGLRLTEADEPVGDFLTRLAKTGVTHLTGTPSHWRRALMAKEIAHIAPNYVRLSGEIADQAILDRLARQFPKARIGHAYASTEAGVGFEVTDGKEGFPLDYLGRRDGPVEMKLEDGVLFVRSTRTASRYLGEGAPALGDAKGFVDTDDMIEVRDGRCYFAGRKAGLINVGGLKIHPEEVEAVLNRHPAVHLARVHARKSPITGALVAAEVVLEKSAETQDLPSLKAEIIALARTTLSAAKAPASLVFVDSLPISAGGKLERRRG